MKYQPELDEKVTLTPMTIPVTKHVFNTMLFTAFLYTSFDTVHHLILHITAGVLLGI